MRKNYFNPKQKRKDPGIENEKRRLNNAAVKKFITSGGYKKPNGEAPRNKQ